MQWLHPQHTSSPHAAQQLGALHTSIAQCTCSICLHSTYTVQHQHKLITQKAYAYAYCTAPAPATEFALSAAPAHKTTAPTTYTETAFAALFPAAAAHKTTTPTTYTATAFAALFPAAAANKTTAPTTHTATAFAALFPAAAALKTKACKATAPSFLTLSAVKLSHPLRQHLCFSIH